MILCNGCIVWNLGVSHYLVTAVVWATRDECWYLYLHIITYVTYKVVQPRSQKYFVLLSCYRYILSIFITYIEVQTICPPIHSCPWITQVSLTFSCLGLLTFLPGKMVQLNCGKQWSMKRWLTSMTNYYSKTWKYLSACVVWEFYRIYLSSTVV